MTAYDQRARTTAARALAPIAQGGKGQVIIVRTRTSGAYNPATASAPAVDTDETGSGLTDGYAHRDRPGTQILAGDLRLLLSPLKIDGAPIAKPKVDATCILADGTGWTVVDVEPLAPAGMAILYTLHLRA